MVGVGSLAVHAEEFRPGGDVLHGDSPDVAVRYAEVFARLMAELTEVTVAPPLPNPRWVRWDHADCGVWPAIEFLDERDQTAVPDDVVHTAGRARRRILAAGLPCVLGHVDFEAQNLRWHGRKVWVVHDWDSLAWQPEAALVGAASGTFANAGPPTLAPIESSEAFLTAYQDVRRRLFTIEEQEVAWAASLWPAAHNARWEALHGQAPLAGTALRAQAVERLRRAIAEHQHARPANAYPPLHSPRSVPAWSPSRSVTTSGQRSSNVRPTRAPSRRPPRALLLERRGCSGSGSPDLHAMESSAVAPKVHAANVPLAGMTIDTVLWR
ncbi:MAG: hypothetical protein ACRDZ2_11025 [Ilumatobacteraceae bacterium]